MTAAFNVVGPAVAVLMLVGMIVASITVCFAGSKPKAAVPTFDEHADQAIALTQPDWAAEDKIREGWST